MTSIIFKIYGTVAYDDGSWSIIDRVYDGRTHGVGTSNDTAESFRNINDDHISDMVSFINNGLHNSLSVSIDPPEIDKVVSSYNLSMSGTVADSDGSVKSFYARMDDLGTSYVPDRPEYNTLVDAFVSYDRDNNQIVVDLFSMLCGLAGY